MKRSVLLAIGVVLAMALAVGLLTRTSGPAEAQPAADTASHWVADLLGAIPGDAAGAVAATNEAPASLEELLSYISEISPLISSVPAEQFGLTVGSIGRWAAFVGYDEDVVGIIANGEVSGTTTLPIAFVYRGQEVHGLRGLIGDSYVAYAVYQPGWVSFGTIHDNSIWVHSTHTVIAVITNVQASVRPEGQPQRMIKLSGDGWATVSAKTGRSSPSNGVNHPVGVHPSNPIVQRIGDIQVSFGVKGIHPTRADARFPVMGRGTFTSTASSAMVPVLTPTPGARSLAVSSIVSMSLVRDISPAHVRPREA